MPRPLPQGTRGQGPGPGDVRQGSKGPVPPNWRRTSRARVEPSRTGAAHACRVVPRSLALVPGPRPLPVVVVLLVLLVGVAIPVGGQTKRDDTLQSEQKKLQQTQKRLKEEREKAAAARARETSLLAELEQTDQRMAEKQADVARLESRIHRTRSDIGALRAEVTRLEGHRTGQEEALARRLRVMYRVHAQGGALPLILSGDDPVTRATAVRHLASLAALDARLIREYRGTSERLADRKGREEARQQELAALHADAQREQAEVDREAAKRRTLLAMVRDERAYHERIVGELTEASRRLEGFIRELGAKQRKLAKVPPPKGGIEPPGVGFGGFRGRLPWPTDGRIVVPFGAQVHPRFGTRTFRNGVDIEAAEGTDVTAVYAGHVIYTGWFKGYGNLIIVDHGSEYYTLYAHIAEIEVKEGEDVRQGQRIGTVGDTASLAGPRLYFEVRYQGRPQDPAEWLRQRG
jgi:murein hydrolase activator